MVAAGYMSGRLLFMELVLLWCESLLWITTYFLILSCRISNDRTHLGKRVHLRYFVFQEFIDFIPAEV